MRTDGALLFDGVIHQENEERERERERERETEFAVCIAA